MIFETTRLYVRQLQKADLEGLHKECSDNQGQQNSNDDRFGILTDNMFLHNLLPGCIVNNVLTIIHNNLANTELKNNLKDNYLPQRPLREK